AAVAARCHGIVGSRDEYAVAFQDALVRHGYAPSFERARTALCLGERLRRSKRPTDAREWLTMAGATLGQLGAKPWLDRAQMELAASGAARMPAISGSLAPRLTAQELHIAQAVAQGATNRDAAAALFLSEKTIEAHLRSVYRKLGISRKA